MRKEKYNIFKQASNCHKLKIFLMIVIVMFSFSCEKKINWDIKSGGENYLIVDGIITNEVKQQRILLTLSNTDMNQSIKYASGANVSVFDGEFNYQFLESETGSGLYISETEFSGVINRKYDLNIEFNEVNYTANADMLPVSVSNPLPYMQMSDSNLYYIAADIANFNPNESFMAEVILDWSGVPGYDTLTVDKTSAHMFFYHLTTLDINQIFSPPSEQILFPVGTYMIQKKYSLTPEHEHFIRSLLAETLWHGGNFDLEEGNVYSNMSEGALGFFGACSIIADTSFVQ